MRHLLLAAVLILILCPWALAAEDSSWVVTQIDVTGRHRTRQWIVTRELRFQRGDTITAAHLERARNRLNNLNVFNEVRVTADSTGRVEVLVSELWSLLPMLSISLTEGTLSDVFDAPKSFFEKATIYAGIGDLNFRGEASSLYGVGQFGAARGVAVSYRTRWLAPRLPIAVRIDAQNLRVLDRHVAMVDSTEYLRDVRYGFDVATRAGAPSRLGVMVRYQTVEAEGRVTTEGKHLRTWWLSPYVLLDRRDLEWYPSRGALAIVRADLVGGERRFVRSQYELRGYIPLHSRRRAPLLALRAYAATTSSGAPGWALYYHGFDTGLRGYSGVKSESAGLVRGEAELRFPITRETTYDVPLIGRYGKGWPWGILGVVFAERDELQIAGRRTETFAVGGGLHFRVPYVQIFEITLAVNREGHTDLSLQTGVSF